MFAVIWMSKRRWSDLLIGSLFASKFAVENVLDSEGIDPSSQGQLQQTVIDYKRDFDKFVRICI